METKQRFFRIRDWFRRTPKTFRWFLVVWLGLCAAWLIENWRGKHNLRRFHQQAGQLGVPYRFSDFQRPEVAPEDDFYAAPVFEEWRTQGRNFNEGIEFPIMDSPYGSVKSGYGYGYLLPIGSFLKPQIFSAPDDAEQMLVVLQPFAEDIERLSAAARRISIRFEGGSFSAFQARVDTSFQIQSAAKLLHLRSRAHIELGHAEAALTDILTMLRISKLLDQPDAFFGSCYVAGFSFGPIWQGLKLKVWNDEQLNKLAAEIEGINFLATFPQAVRFTTIFDEAEVLRRARERHLITGESPLKQFYSGLDSPDLEDVQSGVLKLAKDIGIWLLPDGSFHECVHYSFRQSLDRWVAPGGEPAKETTFAHIQDGWKSYRESSFISPYAGNREHIDYFLISFAKQHLRIQQLLELAQIAIALERCLSTDGQYPDNLNTLTPRLLTKLPTDRYDPSLQVRYRRTSNGRYMLWTSGKDGADNHADPKIDLVWKYADRPAIKSTLP